MCETWSTDLASVWSLGSVTDKEDTHLSLWRLNGRVSLSWWDSVTLGEEQEVVNECLHVLLHGCSWWWRDLVVLNTDWAGWHLVQALVNDAEGLTELLHTAEVTVVAVTVNTDWNVELDLVVCVVWLGLADIPWNTGSTEHDSSEGHVEGVSCRNLTNTLGTADPDTVVGKKLLGLVDAVTELGGPLVDIIQKTNWDILVNTTWSDVGGVETSSGNTLVELHQLLSLLETPQERSQSSNIHSVGQDRHKMVKDTGDLSEESSDPLCTLWNLNVEKLLNSKREALLVGHHGDVIQTIKVWQCLQVCLVLNQLLSSSVQQSDVWIRANNLLSVELQNQTQHSVSSRMLRTEVNCVMSDLAVRDALSVWSLGLWCDVDCIVGSLGCCLSEMLIGWHKASALIWFCVSPRRHGLKGSCRGWDCELWCRLAQAKALGTLASEPV